MLILIFLSSGWEAIAAQEGMRIVLTNDDGVKDLEDRVLPLARKLTEFADVYVVIPWQDRSGSTHFVSAIRTGELEAELRLVEKRSRKRGRLEVHVVRGYPADCVLLALGGLLRELPDLVISGINGGPNLADSWLYSGTIGAARMAAHQGIPAIAISGIDEDHLEDAIGFVVSWVAELVRSPGVRELQPGEYLTIALPPVPPSQIRGVGVAPHASHVSKFSFVRAGTSHSRDLWRLSGDNVATPERDTDIDLVLQQGLISITPMRVGEKSGALLEAWRLRLDTLPQWPEIR